MAEEGPQKSRLPAPKPKADPEPRVEPDGADRPGGRKARDKERDDTGKSRGPSGGLSEEDLEEIGRGVVELISGIRSHNGRGRASLHDADATKEAD